MEKPSKEQIEKRAYELYLERGCVPGLEREDWFAAEAELTYDGILADAATQTAQVIAGEIPEDAVRTRVPKRASVTTTA